MDVEKTMEFILENLADVGVTLAELGVKQARTERQIHGLQTLAKMGVRQLVKLGAAQKRTEKMVYELAVSHRELAASHKELAASHKELAASQKELAASHKLTEKALRELAVSQKRTDEKFQRWLDRGHNGKSH